MVDSINDATLIGILGAICVGDGHIINNDVGTFFGENTDWVIVENKIIGLQLTKDGMNQRKWTGVLLKITILDLGGSIIIFREI